MYKPVKLPMVQILVIVATARKYQESILKTEVMLTASKLQLLEVSSQVFKMLTTVK